MAGIKPPRPFDFQNAADWPAWMDEFDDYSFVSGLHEIKDEVQSTDACSNLRRQQLGETVDQFAAELSKLADRCEFASMKERLIRDRFVVGLRDQVLSEELQMDPKLTMATASARARTSETVKQQHAELKSMRARSETLASLQ
ncbi:hypothetical protein MRX96_006079 [Rhipicephalus microplus]